MMDMPLLIFGPLEHAARYHGTTEVVARTVEGRLHRYTYADVCARAKRLSSALRRMGVRQGERVGSLSWNTHRHLEAYYGVIRYLTLNIEMIFKKAGLRTNAPFRTPAVS